MAYDSVTVNPAKQGLYSPTTLDLAMHNPVVYNKIIKKFSNQYRGDNLATDLMLSNSTLGIASDDYTMFQEGWYWENMTVKTGSVAGSTQTLVLEESALDTVFVKPGQVILYPGSTLVTGYINNVEVSGTDIEVSVIAGSGITLPVVADGDILMISNNAFGEGSDQPKATAKKYDKLQYNLQILKDTVKLTGSLLTDDTWVDFSEYDTKFDWYNTMVADAEARMDTATSNALMWNTGAVYTADATSVANGLADAIGDEIVETKGLVKWAQEEGLELGTDAGVADYADFDDIDNYLREQGDNSPYIIGRLGNKLAKAYSRALFDNFGSDTGIDVTAQMLMSQGMDEQEANARAMVLNYKQYSDGSRTYLWKTGNEFSNPKTLATTGYSKEENGIWYPCRNVGDEGMSIPAVTMLYKQKGADNRMREFWDLAGAGGNSANYTLTRDVKEAYLRSDVGLAVGAPNLLIYSNSLA